MAVLTAAAVGTAAVGAGLSFAQAGKQNKLRKKAQEDAAKFAKEARQKLGVNYFDELAIQKEPYELQREAMLAQGADLMQAGIEGSDRGVGAVAGRIQQAQNQGQSDIRTGMAQDMLNLDIMSAQQDQTNMGRLANVDVMEAQGAQLAAKDAQEASAAAMTAGFDALNQGIGSAASTAPLYSKTGGAKAAGDVSNMISSGQIDSKNIAVQLGLSPNASIADIQAALVGMDEGKAKTFMNTLNSLTNPQARKGENPFDINLLNPNYLTPNS
jgi:hypothetical protein